MKTKPYAEEVAAIKQQIREEEKRLIGSIRKRKYFYVVRCASFYIGVDTKFDGGGRSWYSYWHIHLTEDLTSENLKKFETIQEAVALSKNLPFETVVKWLEVPRSAL